MSFLVNTVLQLVCLLLQQSRGTVLNIGSVSASLVTFCLRAVGAALALSDAFALQPRWHGQVAHTGPWARLHQSAPAQPWTAWALLGKPSPDRKQLADIAPDLHKALSRWRGGRGEIPKAMTLAEGAPEVLPRFVALSLTDNLYLIFLEDSRVFSNRAEELTLATLGRLSASIAHEIRNPLAAISYAQQLMADSPDLAEGDPVDAAQRSTIDSLGCGRVIRSPPMSR